MTEDRTPVAAVLAPVLALSALFAVGAMSFDFPCMPGYADSGLGEGITRGAALIAGARLALGQPGLLVPLFLGYLLVLGAAFGLPLFHPRGSKTRNHMGFATLAVILAVLAIIAFTGPGRDCSAGTVAWEILGNSMMAAGAIIAGAYLLGRRADRA